MTDLFVRLYDFFLRRKILLFSIVVAWLAACVFIVANAKFKEDITSAFPHDEQIRKANEVLKNSPFLERLYVVVKFRDDVQAPTSDLTQVADEFREKTLAAVSGDQDPFAELRVKVNEEVAGELIDLTYNNIPYYLDANDYRSIDSSLTETNIANAMDAGYQALISPAGFALKKYFTKDPLGILWRGMKKFEKLSVSENFTMKDGYILTKDGRNLMVFARASKTVSGANDKMMSAIDKGIASTIANHGDVEIIYYGTPAMSRANARQVRTDIYFTVGLAMFILIMCLSYYFRRWYAFPFLMIPVAFGAITAMAAVTLLRGSISVISLGIGSIMLGIILDYSLHIYTHFRENGNARELIHEVAGLLMATSGTNVLAFLCLLTLTSVVLQDLGLFAAVSIGSAALFTLIVFPHLMGTPPVARQNRLLWRIAEYPLEKAKFLFPLFLVLILGSLYFVPRTSFNANLDKLSFLPKDLERAENHLDRISDFKLKKIYLIAEGKDLESALAKSQSYIGVLDSLQEESVIDGYSSVNMCWPDSQLRGAKMSEWKSFWNADRIAGVKSRVIQSCVRLGIRPEAFDGFFAWLEQPMVYSTSQAMETLRPLFVSDLLQETDGGVTIVNVLRVKEENKAIVYEALHADGLAFDNKYIFNRLVQVLQNDLQLLEFLSFFLVLTVVLLTFRRFELAMVTMTPMLSSWLITLGIMGAFGLEFNIFNIVICTFIFGLGIDYSIFFGRGLLDQYRGNTHSLPTFRISILLSLLTTLLGIGVMIFARHPALRSIASVSLIGLFSVASISFFLQPVLYRFLLYIKGVPRKVLVTPMSFWRSCYFLGGYFIIGIIVWLLGLVVLRLKGGRRFLENSFSWMCRMYLSTAFSWKQNFAGIDRKQFENSILIANHQSMIDLVIIAAISGKIRVITKDWIFKLPFIGGAARMLGFYSMEESSRPEFPERVKRELEAGYTVMFFPEGTRTLDGSIHRFRKGAFLLADQLKVDIVPMLIYGTFSALPPGTALIAKGMLMVRVFPRITPADTGYPKEYSARAKKVCEMMRARSFEFQSEMDTNRFIRRALMPRYVYRGPAVRKAYKDMFRGLDSYRELNVNLPYNADISIIGVNQSELLSYLLYAAPLRKVLVFEMNEQKKIEIEFLKNWHAGIEVADDLQQLKKRKILIAESGELLDRVLSSDDDSDIRQVFIVGKNNILHYPGWKLTQHTNWSLAQRDGEF